MKNKFIILSLLFSILSFNSNGTFGFNKLTAQCPGHGGHMAPCVCESLVFDEMFNALNNFNNSNSTEGESFGDESGDNNTDQGWVVFDLNSALIGSGNLAGSTFGNFLDSYGDPFAGHYTPDELLNILIYNNSILSYSGSYMQQTSATPATPDDKYYITVSSDTTKYFKGDKIYIKQTTSNVVFRLNSLSGGSIKKDSLRWYIDTTFKTKNSLLMNYVPNTINILEQKLRVIDTSSKVLIDNPLVVYDKPTILFERKDGYDGEYGFDDEGHKYDSIKFKPKYSAGYEIKSIGGDANYYVPWMSLLDSQSAQVKLRKIGFESLPPNDPIFPVRIKTVEQKIKINTLDSLVLPMAFLQGTESLDIFANEWTPLINNVFMSKIVFAIGANGDTLGKMRLSCHKPKERKMQIVYVKTGSSYFDSTFTKAQIENHLNTKGHNQLFRKWINTNIYSDTLDLTNLYATKPQKFNDNELPKLMRTYYKLHKGIDVLSVNAGYDIGDTAYRKFFFMTNFTPYTDSTRTSFSRTSGVTNGDGEYAVFFATPLFTLGTLPHEVGHSTFLAHTFSETDTLSSGTIKYYHNYGVPKYSTRNFMDYRYENDPPKNRFWFCQLVDVK